MVAVVNGAAALHLSLKLVGVREVDEVLAPALGRTGVCKERLLAAGDDILCVDIGMAVPVLK